MNLAIYNVRENIFSVTVALRCPALGVHVCLKEAILVLIACEAQLRSLGPRPPTTLRSVRWFGGGKNEPLTGQMVLHIRSAQETRELPLFKRYILSQKQLICKSTNK